MFSWNWPIIALFRSLCVCFFSILWPFFWPDLGNNFDETQSHFGKGRCAYACLSSCIPRCCLKSEVGRQHSGAGYGLLCSPVWACSTCHLLFSGSSSHAMVLPDRHSVFRAKRQGGILNLVPASPFLPIFEWAPVGTPTCQVPPWRDCSSRDRDWPAREYGSIGCQSWWGHGWTTGNRDTCEISLPPGFSNNHL